uniref:Ribonuclease H n=1 Tax=Strongyloides venezuelensis TaxID=75913 RepID=A0A0K0FSF5_STRVS
MVSLVKEEIVAHHVTRDKLLQSMILDDRNFEIRRALLPQFTRVLSLNQVGLAIKNLEMKEAADLKELNATLRKNFDLLRIENNALMHSDLHCGSKYLQNVFGQVAVTVSTIKLCQEVVKLCELCSVFRNRCKQKLRSWIAPLNSRERSHVDIAELNRMLMFVFTNTYSGAIIMMILKNKSSQSIVETLMSIFAYFGVWQVMISDNEWCFQNSYVDEFLESPVTNGNVEKAVQSVKKTVKKLLKEEVNKRFSNTKKNELRGATTAPRAEVEAYLMVLRVLADGMPDNGTREKTLIKSDCSYILTGKNSSNQPCAHFNQWKEIQSLLLKLGDKVTTKHVPGHTYQFHDCADKLARADEKLVDLNNI